MVPKLLTRRAELPMQVHSKHSLRKYVYAAFFNSIFPFVGRHPATIRKSLKLQPDASSLVLLQPIYQNTRKSMTPDVYLGRNSSLVCCRTRQGMTSRTSRLTMIRSQMCIGATRSCVIARADLMANRGCLRDGFWSVLANMTRIARQVAAMVGLTVVLISSMCPHVP
ncbi:hypothetical protein M405DRAFT_350034 [Rhizopogon salebrosus TDB-379]|nr:hypothetical protein M405DRAFT_350034 [Rhizopogon salebrosus TDB-379]